eukprot:g3172.t1
MATTAKPSEAATSGEESKSSSQSKKRSGMDVMMSLEGRKLDELREIFMTKEDGLTLQEFVSTLVEKLEKTIDTVDDDFISDLIELFKEIDINGDGTMEWNEFTKFCVESGLVATRRQIVPLAFMYKDQAKYTDKTSSGPFIRRLRYFKELKLFASCEAETHFVRVYTHDCKLMKTLDLAKVEKNSMPGKDETLNRKKQTEDEDEIAELAEAKRSLSTIEALDVEYIDTKKLMIILCNNMKGYMIDVNTTKNPALEDANDAKVPRKYDVVGSFFTRSLQVFLRWCAPSNILLSGGHSSGVIQVWRIRFMKKQTRIADGGSRRKGRYIIDNTSDDVNTIHGHTAVVMDALALPNHKLIVTASLDKSIKLWDESTLQNKGELLGHKRGVRQLAYTKDQDILLSCGFEFEAYGWDVGQRQRIMILKAHYAPIVGIQIVPFEPLNRAITTDETGHFKLWDITKTLNGKAYVMQGFQAETVVGRFNPRSIIATDPFRHIVAAGCKLKKFDSVKIKASEDPPIAALYNATNMTFIIAMGRTIEIKDARTGKREAIFHNIVKSEITSLCMDFRQRKLIVGTQKGDITEFSYRHGVYMKEFESHHKDIISLRYCGSDCTLISASWDREIRIYDDITPDSGPLLRRMKNVHAKDISCCEYSHELGLIATGSADFSVRLWDYQLAKLDSDAVCEYHRGEITSMAFVPGWPLLVSADANGMICVWGVRPCPVRYSSPLFVFDNVGSKEPIIERGVIDVMEIVKAVSVPVTNIEITTNSADGTFSLLVGDERGRISNINFEKVLKLLTKDHGIVPIRENQNVTKAEGYNARRYLVVDCSVIETELNEQRVSNTEQVKKMSRLSSFERSRDWRRRGTQIYPRLRRGSMLSAINLIESGLLYDKEHGELDVENVEVICMWKAHLEPLRTLHYIDEVQGCISCSFDLSVRIWCIKTGTQIACIAMGEKERFKLSIGEIETVPYMFKLREDERRKESQKEVQVLKNELNQLKEEEEERRKEEEATEARRSAYRIKRRNSIARSRRGSKESTVGEDWKMVDVDSTFLTSTSIPTMNTEEIPPPVRLDINLNTIPMIKTETTNRDRSASTLTLGGHVDQYLYADDLIDSEFEHIRTEDDIKRDKLLSQLNGRGDDKSDNAISTDFENVSYVKIRGNPKPVEVPAYLDWRKRKDSDLEEVKTENLLKPPPKLERSDTAASGGADMGNKKSSVRHIIFDSMKNLIKEQTRLKKSKENIGKQRFKLDSSDFLIKELKLEGTRKADGTQVMRLKHNHQQERKRHHGRMHPRRPETTVKLEPLHVSQSTADLLNNNYSSGQQKQQVLSRTFSAPTIGGKRTGRRKKGQKESHAQKLSRKFTHIIDVLENAPAVPKRKGSFIPNEEALHELQDRIDDTLHEYGIETEGRTRKPKRSLSTSSFSSPRKSSSIEPMELNSPFKDVTNFGQYTVKDVLHIKRIFDKYDVDGSGEIDVYEFSNSNSHADDSLFQHIGSIFATIDVDGSGTLTLDEILRVVCPLASEEELGRMLTYCTESTIDGSGSLDRNEIMDVLESAGIGNMYSRHDIDTMIEKYDTDHNHLIDIDEFIQMMKASFIEQNDPKSRKRLLSSGTSSKFSSIF